MAESKDTIAFATEPLFASLANVLGKVDNLPQVCTCVANLARCPQSRESRESGGRRVCPLFGRPHWLPLAMAAVARGTQAVRAAVHAACFACAWLAPTTAGLRVKLTGSAAAQRLRHNGP